MTIETLIWLFPIVFMIHEFEEIIFMKSWIKKNTPIIEKRFPVMGKRFKKFAKGISTRKFALIVAEEFLIISAITIISAQWSYINLFAGLLLTYSLHLLVHIFQFAIYRRYTPAIVTSLLSVPYAACTLTVLINAPTFALRWSLAFFGILSVAMAGNLFACHSLVKRIKI